MEVPSYLLERGWGGGGKEVPGSWEKLPLPVQRVHGQAAAHT